MKDESMTILYQAKKENKRPENLVMEGESPKARPYWVIWDDIHLKGEVLNKYLQKLNQTGTYEQLLVPKDMLTVVLHQAHDTLLGGHLGIKKKKKRMAQRAY